MSGRCETHNIEIRDPDSIKDYFTGRRQKNAELVSAILHYIDTHFTVKVGDVLRVRLEFEDYHGYECYVSVAHFVPVKMQVHERLWWHKDESSSKT